MGNASENLGMANQAPTPGMPPELAAIYGGDPMAQYLAGPNTQVPPQTLNPSPQPSLAQSLVNPPPTAAPSGGQDAINVDGWHPHHRTTLGAIADIGLALLGLPIAPFKHQANKQNLQEVMEGFTSDPLHSIQRLSKIPGMEDKAWKLFEDYQQIHKNDEETDQRISYYKGMNEDRARGVLSSYLGGIGNSRHPEETYKKMLPTLRKFVEQRALPNELLPDTWDPDLAQAVVVGGIKPEDQARIQESRDYHKTTAQLRQEEIDQTGEYRGARLGQMNRHEQAYEQHNANMEDISSTRETRLAKGKNGVTYVRTKYGPGEVAPNGTSMRVQVGGMNHFYFKVGDGKWKHVKSTPIDTTKDQSNLNYGNDGADNEDDSDEDDK
jgi:hypothetical protein